MCQDAEMEHICEGISLSARSLYNRDHLSLSFTIHATSAASFASSRDNLPSAEETDACAFKEYSVSSMRAYASTNALTSLVPLPGRKIRPGTYCLRMHTIFVKSP